jgi:hypothetical protein
VDGRGIAMEKYVIKTSLAFVIIAVLLLILLGLLSRDSFEPSYRFLGGREPISSTDLKTAGLDRRYIYSFEGDFNDICLKVDKELNGENFARRAGVGKDLSGNEHRIRGYWIPNRFPRGQVWIVIHNNLQYIELPNPKDYAIYEKDGWILVEIVYGRGWRWPF